MKPSHSLSVCLSTLCCCLCLLVSVLVFPCRSVLWFMVVSVCFSVFSCVFCVNKCVCVHFSQLPPSFQHTHTHTAPLLVKLRVLCNRLYKEVLVFLSKRNIWNIVAPWCFSPALRTEWLCVSLLSCWFPNVFESRSNIQSQCRANFLTFSFPKILAFATYGPIKVGPQYSYFNSYLHLMALKSFLIFLKDPATLSKGSPLRMTVLTPPQQWEVNWNSYGLHTQRVKLMHFCQAFFFFSPLKWEGVWFKQRHIVKI